MLSLKVPHKSIFLTSKIKYVKIKVQESSYCFKIVSRAENWELVDNILGILYSFPHMCHRNSGSLKDTKG